MAAMISASPAMTPTITFLRLGADAAAALPVAPTLESCVAESCVCGVLCCGVLCCGVLCCGVLCCGVHGLLLDFPVSRPIWCFSFDTNEFRPDTGGLTSTARPIGRLMVASPDRRMRRPGVRRSSRAGDDF